MEGLSQALRVLAEAQDRFHHFTSSNNNVIPVMQWEKQLQGVLDLSIDQQRFMLSLFTSVLVGLGMRGLRNTLCESAALLQHSSRAAELLPVGSQ